MTVKDLKSVNPKIDLSEIDMMMALYAGGKRFEPHKRDFLIHREAENMGLASIEVRLKRAQYINRAAGLVDWIVSGATQDGPRIESENEYFQALNDNSDGLGTPFSSLVRCLLADMLVARWPYVEAVSIDSDPFVIRRRDPETVCDFENNDDGSLRWLKTISCQLDRSNAYAAPDRMLVVVTYYTDTDTVSYTAYKPLKGDQWQDATGKALGDNDVLMPDPERSVFGHDFGGVPVFRGNATKTHWLMDRISEPLKAIYNTEVDLSFSLSQCAYAQLIFMLESQKRAETIARSEAGAWVLLPGEEAKYLAPPNTAFDGLFRNLERLSTALRESLQMVATETANIPQAGRLSGEAVKEHRRPLDGLVDALTWPVRDMLQRCLDGIADYYGYERPTITGIGGREINIDEAAERAAMIGSAYQESDEAEEEGEEVDE